MLTKAPKGTKDILPEQSRKWQYVESAARDICARFGYREIRTPIFEHTELFLRGVGDTTDIVRKEMYTFEDKGGRSITLRPEGTAGVVRSFVENGLFSQPLPAKLYYISVPVFRYERPQAGRLRQHHQFGIETFGAISPSIDAEVICVALTLLKSLGVSGLSLNINSIGCGRCRPSYNAVLKKYLAERRGKLCANCCERMETNPLRILDCKEEQCKETVSGAPVILGSLCDDCAKHFEGLKRYLECSGIKYSINPFIVRGLDYYTKTVFEIISDGIGAQGTVCGGGRYDSLVEQIGGPAIPGIGFGLGMERLLLVLESLGVKLPDANVCDACVCPVGEDAALYAFSITAIMREEGIAAECDHMGRSLKAQLKFAAKLNAAYAVIIGESEIAAKAAVVRDMRKGEEKTVPFTGLNAYIKAGII
ncbi:MAG: histidine--tRNA ligase [Christensenellales bacterium]